MTTALAGSLAVLVISGSVRSGVSESRAPTQPAPLALSAISGALTSSMKNFSSLSAQNSLDLKAQALRRSVKATVR